MGLRDPEPERQSPWGAVVAAVVAVAGIIVGWRTCGRDIPQTGEPTGTAVSAAPSASAADSVAPVGVPDEVRAPSAPRCFEVSSDGLVIGEAPAPRPAPAPTNDTPIPTPQEPDDTLAPFAVEVGRGTVFEGGFAVGALRDAEGGTVAMIATIGADGKNGGLVRLARSRGDLEAPVVYGLGPSVLAVLIEPNAGGRSIKVAKVTSGEVTWGAELSEGRDESLAMDLAASGERAVLVWDDVLRDAKRSSVILASFDTGSLRSVTRARPVSPPSVDADSPRIVARPGGYWLAYVAQTPEDDSPPPRRNKGGKAADSDIDEERGGETIINRWVELVPLDETGSGMAIPRAVTPKNGHVLAFDLELGQDSAALIAWRDDDTPSGSSGGRVSTVLARLGGEGEPRVVAEEGVGAGVPELLPGWLSVASLSGPGRLGAMALTGELLDALAPEASLGTGGEPIAATKDALLVVRPIGRAMKLSVMKCSPTAPAVPTAKAAEP